MLIIEERMQIFKNVHLIGTHGLERNTQDSDLRPAMNGSCLPFHNDSLLSHPALCSEAVWNGPPLQAPCSLLSSPEGSPRGSPGEEKWKKTEHLFLWYPFVRLPQTVHDHPVKTTALLRTTLFPGSCNCSSPPPFGSKGANNFAIIGPLFMHYPCGSLTPHSHLVNKSSWNYSNFSVPSVSYWDSTHQSLMLGVAIRNTLKWDLIGFSYILVWESGTLVNRWAAFFSDQNMVGLCKV